jgi:hypothetical protein
MEASASLRCRTMHSCSSARIAARLDGYVAARQLCDHGTDEITMTETRPPDVGDVGPDFTLPDATATLRRLADLCAARPTVLVFYRGHW